MAKAKKNTISCCFFPTKVVLVDDNKRFLDSLKLALGEKSVIYDYYTDPADFLSFFNEKYKPTKFTNKWLSWLDEEYFDHRTVDVDIRAIHREIFNVKRFQEISIVVSDYAMPGMDGLELFAHMEERGPVKKIMLTGEADEMVAVKAFNNGLIDRFIHKGSPDFIEELNCAIYELQKEYFRELTVPVLNSMTQEPGRRSCLSDPTFVDFFYKTFEENDFIEYYLVDEFGSFLFLDANGNPSWLAVKTPSEMEHYQNLAEYCEQMPEEVAKVIKSREKIPFLFSDEDFEVPPEKWAKYLHPATRLEGREEYYYSFIKKSEVYGIESDSVLSFNEYLEEF